MQNGQVETKEGKIFYAFVCSSGKCLSEYKTFADLMPAFDNWIMTDEGREMKKSIEKLFTD